MFYPVNYEIRSLFFLFLSSCLWVYLVWIRCKIVININKNKKILMVIKSFFFSNWLKLSPWSFTRTSFFFPKITAEHQDYSVLTVFVTVKTSCQNNSQTLSFCSNFTKIVIGIGGKHCGKKFPVTLINLYLSAIG